MLLVGVGLTPSLLYDAPERLKQLKSKQILQDRIALRDARRALMQYMLLRSQQPFNIARIGGEWNQSLGQENNAPFWSMHLIGTFTFLTARKN